MQFNWTLYNLSIILFMSTFQSGVETKNIEAVDVWAERFGRDLWKLGETITKATELKAKYIKHNAQVEVKDPKKLMASVVENVSRMLSRKMDAIKCILKAAEDASEKYEFNDTANNFTYNSAKFSPIEGEKEPELPENMEEDKDIYRNMCLNEDSHFYYNNVNTSYSVVHVPTNIYDKGQEVREAIEWSEALDEVFVQNYNSDPALSWQYFGSSTGILRQYPAIKWPNNDNDNYDCRTHSWYIEAATCSKDMVILLDNSGSMYGMRNTIAQFTLSNILDTLSNNDFVNVFIFNDTVQELVPCFNETLVQATPENMNEFRSAAKGTKPEGNANFTNAFTKAFTILQQYRKPRGCENNTECNQVIMLVTDGVPGNLTEIFETYNRLNNSTDIPVRIFTYLLGSEVTKVREIQWLACLNRGYYVHVHSLEEVTEQVLKYISVIARPLVLQEHIHPISWTHAFVNTTNPEECSYCDYRLLTYVAVPAYDKKINRKNDTRTANLLGVAATDVPIDDIEKLTLPYKLGVNGYAFVVSNNGYVLLHPDLRPYFQGILKENYNSVDLTEIEQIDENLGPRELGQQIVQLREALVNYSSGSMLNVSVKFHFDEMRRVTHQMMDFHYAPLLNTPFSIALAMPQGYGSMWIKVGDELRKNLHMNVSIPKLFEGDNWKIHPQWVYCKYHYLEGHEFSNSEEELLHFLHKMSDLSKWKWSQQYEADPILDDIAWGPNGTLEESYEFNCGRKTLGDEDYYCNHELVQRLVFDAKVTESFMNWTLMDKLNDQQIFETYEPTLRFVATMSGLTRWQYVWDADDYDNNTQTEFGDYHSKAIDETWYKSAVLQHEVNADSFVFSVPPDAWSKKEDVLVTASHAVFPRDGGQEAPGSVVGYQFKHSALKKQFIHMTTCPVDEFGNKKNCTMECIADEIDCYVIDSSGYIILAENNNMGKFFGEVEGAIMKTMLGLGIFKQITIYDLQAMCFNKVQLKDSGNSLLNPFDYMKFIFQWIVSKIIWIITETYLYQIWDPNRTYTESLVIPDTIAQDRQKLIKKDNLAEIENITLPERPKTVTKKQTERRQEPNTEKVDVTVTSATPETTTKIKLRKGQNLEEEEYFNRKIVPVFINVPYSCDKYVNLYELQQKELKAENQKYHQLITAEISRPFYVRSIPHTNMLLVVVKTTFRNDYKKISTTPVEITYENGTEPPCHKLYLNPLTRRRLTDCFSDHELESEINMCGKSNLIMLNTNIILFAILLNMIYN